MSNTLQTSLRHLQDRLFAATQKSGRAFNSVQLIGVSKKQLVEKVIQAAKSGLVQFGENYVQELKEKWVELQNLEPRLAQEIRWHFIGHLQTNKVKDVVGYVNWIHTVDSLRLASKISEQAVKLNITQRVLLEVNLGREPNKSGFLEEDLMPALSALSELPALSIEGLMIITPDLANPEDRRPYFQQLRKLMEKIQGLNLFPSFQELSMGMSDDFEIAIEEGATMVRVGTALFGVRG